MAEFFDMLSLSQDLPLDSPQETFPSRDSATSSSNVKESAMDIPLSEELLPGFQDSVVDESAFDPRVYQRYLPTLQHNNEEWMARIKEHHDYINKLLARLLALNSWFDENTAAWHTSVEDEYAKLTHTLRQDEKRFDRDTEKYRREKGLLREVQKFQNEKVTLNVGGQRFQTSKSTLLYDPDSILAQIFDEHSPMSPEPDGSYFFDRDSTYFRLILNYLRDKKLPQSVQDDQEIMDELMQEAQYYRLKGLLRLRWDNLPTITQEELIKRYPPPSESNNKRGVVFQLERMNLSNLDFSGYRIDPRSSFAGSNLQNSRFDQAVFIFEFDCNVNFSNTYLVGASFPDDDTDKKPPGVVFNLQGAIRS